MAALDWKKARKTIEAYVDGWRTGDKAAWLSLFREDAVLRDPVDQPPFEGKAAIDEFWDRTRSMGLQMVPDVTRIAICGQEALLVFRMSALASDGSGMSVDVCDIFTLDDEGRIRELKAYWDKGCIRVIAPT